MTPSRRSGSDRAFTDIFYPLGYGYDRQQRLERAARDVVRAFDGELSGVSYKLTISNLRAALDRCERNDGVVPVGTLLSDRVLDQTLDFLAIRAIAPGGDNSVENLARWDLKAALVEVLGREGIHA